MAKSLEERKKILLELMQDDMYVPMREKELAIIMQLPKERRAELTEALDALLFESKIECSKRGKYSIMRDKTVDGTFIGTRNGYGFVSLPDRDEDIFIPEKDTGHAMHGDEVRVLLLATPRGKRQEGKVVEILTHANNEIVGFFEKSSSYGFVLPDNQRLNEDIFIPEKAVNGAKYGDKVICRLTSYGDEKKKPEGEIIEILGSSKDVGVDILSIARAYGMKEEFPEEVEDELKAFADEVPEEDKRGRLDLRDTMMVTIDGVDAKDLDDAVSVTFDGEKYELGVHIADVSNYVKEKTALNKEGYNRATSVYLADRVIPMLPRKLSNGLCSLNEGVDRLALSCIMTIDDKGIITDHKIVETVINVDRRMSYPDVKAILDDNDPALCEKYKELVPMFLEMRDLAALLRKNRKKRGSIDFDLPETKVVLDAKGHTIDIVPYERNVATMMIEDFMLAANETVAEEYYFRELPFLYRSHEKPDADKMEELTSLIGNLGYSLKGKHGEVHPKEMQKLLAKIEGEPEAGLIMRLSLRSMQQARYTAENLGHYGLAAKYYCHFTSPIRRYPDLQIHRIIKENLHGKLNEKRIAHYREMLDEVGSHCSSRERRADEVERETIKLKKIEYMQDHFNEVFTGVISGVTDYGIYVELPNTVEGMVRMVDIPGDYYEYIEEEYAVVGKDTGKIYKLGMEVKVMLKDIDRLSRTLDFVFEEEPS